MTEKIDRLRAGLTHVAATDRSVENQRSRRLAAPAQNRSLERGIHILRAFRVGANVMGNSELAERTNLSTATVSRLTQTLVKTGLLDYDAKERAYRLSVAALSLGHAVTFGSPIIKLSSPLLQKFARKYQLNVGLATRDLNEMVYLNVEHFNKSAVYRRIVPGHRVPMESTSLGHAYLSTLSDAQRNALLRDISLTHPQWHLVQASLEASLRNLDKLQVCMVKAWQPGYFAMATPVRFKRFQVHVINISVRADHEADVSEMMASELVALADAVRLSVESGALTETVGA